MSSFSASDKPTGERSSFGDVASEPPTTAPQVGVVEDVAKGFGSGVERGVVGLPGIPTDLARLAQLGWLTLQEKLYGPEHRKRMEELTAQGESLLPGSQEIIQAATPYVPGIDYQPQTLPGRMSQTVGEMTPGAVGVGALATRGAALGTKLARGVADFFLQAAAPGVVAEGAQELAGGETAPGWVKPAAAVATSIATGHVPVPGVTPRVPGVAPGASERLNRAAIDEGGYPAVRQTLDDLGPEGRLVDAGPNFVRQGEALVSMPGAAQPHILKAIRDRQAGTRDRITDLSNRAMGSAEDFELRTTQLIQAKKAQGDTLYGAARALGKPIDVKPVIADIESRVPLSVQSGQVKANDIEAALLKAKDQLAGRSTVDELHIAQDALAGAAQKAKQAGDGPLARELSKVREGLLRQLDQGTLDQSGQSLYGKARATYRGDSAIIDAREEGLSIFDRATRPQTFAREFRQKPQAEQAALKQGGREAVEILLDEARTNATNVLKKLQLPGNEEKLRVLLGPREAGELLHGLRREARFGGTAGRLEGQAATAGRLRAQEEFPQTIAAPELPLAQRTLTPGQLVMTPVQGAWKKYAMPVIEREREATRAATNIDTARGLMQPAPADLLAQLQRAYEQGPRRVMPGVQPGFAAYGANLDEDDRRRR